MTKTLLRCDHRAEIGKAFLSQFEVRFGPGLQADIILPGPPLSWAFTMVDNFIKGIKIGEFYLLRILIQGSG
jgi:hypothetical protein